MSPREFVFLVPAIVSAIGLHRLARGDREGFLIGAMAQTFWAFANVLDGRPLTAAFNVLFFGLYAWGYLRRVRLVFGPGARAGLR